MIFLIGLPSQQEAARSLRRFAFASYPRIADRIMYSCLYLFRLQSVREQLRPAAFDNSHKLVFMPLSAARHRMQFNFEFGINRKPRVCNKNNRRQTLNVDTKKDSIERFAKKRLVQTVL